MKSTIWISLQHPIWITNPAGDKPGSLELTQTLKGEYEKRYDPPDGEDRVCFYAQVVIKDNGESMVLNKEIRLVILRTFIVAEQDENYGAS